MAAGRIALAASLSAFVFAGAATADTLIVGNKGDDDASFINLDTGRTVLRAQTGDEPHEIAVSPDGETAAIVAYGTGANPGNEIHVYDVARGARTGVISLGDNTRPHGLQWLPGSPSRVAVTTEGSRKLLIVDIAAGDVVEEMSTDQNGSHMVALAPDGSRAFVANIGSGSFSVFDLASMERIQNVKAGTATEAVAVTPDGSEVWVGNNNSNNVMVFDAATLESKAVIETGRTPIRVVISPDGRYAAVSEYSDDQVGVFDVATRERLHSVELLRRGGPVTLLFSPSGDRLFAALPGAASVAEIDTQTWTVTRYLIAGRRSDGLGYSPVDTRSE